jgi:hypothetical protein
MSQEHSYEPRIPVFRGETGEKYRIWRSKILWLASGTPDDKRHLLASNIISKFEDAPANEFRSQDPMKFRTPNGVELLLQMLDQAYGDFADAELSQTCLNFFYVLRREGKEDSAKFATRFKTAVARVEGLIDAELARESGSADENAARKYREDMLTWTIEQRRWRIKQAAHDAEVLRIQTQINDVGQLFAPVPLFELGQILRLYASTQRELHRHLSIAFTHCLYGELA